MDAADAGEKPSPAAAESGSRQQDQQWLATLSEPELDLLISLKELAATRAKNAGHPHLVDKFDLRTLRALGIVLLQNFKERLKETSVDPNIFDRLALLSDSDADFTNSGSDSEVVRPNEDQQTPIDVERIRKEMQDGWHKEAAPSQKKRKKNEREELAASIDALLFFLPVI